MKIEIIPLEKMVVDGLDVCLGMKRTDAERIVGQGQLVGERCYYWDSELAICYDKNDRIHFMEFLGGVDGRLKPVIYGVSAFDAGADEVLAVLKQRNGDGILDTEHGYSYGFQTISVGVYRESTPADVAEMLEEAVRSGEPMSDEDVKYETRKAHHWATIGFGVKGYYM